MFLKNLPVLQVSRKQRIPAMPFFSTCRVVSGSLLLAWAVPVSAQSFYHAPATPPGQGSLLPVIQPRHASNPERSSFTPFDIWPGKKSRPEPPQHHSANRPVEVPSHLLANAWSRLPEGPNRGTIPPAPAANGLSSQAIAGNMQQPPQPPVHDALGHSLAVAAQSTKSGDSASAIRILESTIARFPNDARPALSLARLHESEKNWAGAEAAYKVVMGIEPSDPRWKLRSAECLYRQSKFSEAVSAYKAADAASAKMTPDEVAQYGDAALRTGDSKTAEIAFGKLAATKKEPDPRVELLRGLAALKQGKTQEARGILLQASARWPQDTDLTEALRVTSSVHYGDRIAVAKQDSEAKPTEEEDRAIFETTAFSAVEEPKVTATASSIGWRRSREAVKDTEKVVGKVLNSAKIYEAYEEAANEAAAIKAEAIDGWRATRSRGEPAPLAPAGDQEPRPLPLN